LPPNPPVAYLCLVRRMNRAHIAALLMVPLAQGAPPPISVPFRELINHPAKYNGKRVSVRAYMVTSCTHCGEFWESVKAARDSRVHDTRVQNWIAIGRLAKPSLMDFWPRDRLASANPKIPNDGFVFVTGTFRWNDTSLPVRKETERIRSIRVGGFGWMGDDDKTITDITECRPLGENIPAGIN
jgi:hypothetical protein